MRKLAWDASFQRAYRKWLRKDPRWQGRIFEALELLSADTFGPKLKTHKLKGQLEGLWACWVEYDCRIVFTFEPDPDADEDMIVLVDIGTHDEVY
ncbi:MAG: type II toxin-antitoxin system mRNA interferase toxin, RelE/StbE family [bacterium]|nr:type II toxin-antitoxin system mRNA interferase toxin, RelE/StbE family [bacterium]